MNLRCRLLQKCISAVTLLFGIPEAAELDFAGFFDIKQSYDLKAGGEAGFGIGQCEFDLAVETEEGHSADIAFALYPDAETVGIATAVYSHYLLADENREDGLFLNIGRFDIPFGMDFMYLPSSERPMITMPLMNERLLNGWNSTGLDLGYYSEKFDFDAYAVNGFQSQTALGGRLSFRPAETLELGASAAGDIGSTDSAMTSIGAHAGLTLSSVELLAEMQSSANVNGGEAASGDLSGAYLHLILDIDDLAGLPFWTYGRFSAVEDASGSYETRTTFGAGWSLTSFSNIKLEYFFSSEDDGREGSGLNMQALFVF